MSRFLTTTQTFSIMIMIMQTTGLKKHWSWNKTFVSWPNTDLKASVYCLFCFVLYHVYQVICLYLCINNYHFVISFLFFFFFFFSSSFSFSFLLLFLYSISGLTDKSFLHLFPHSLPRTCVTRIRLNSLEILA